MALCINSEPKQEFRLINDSVELVLRWYRDFDMWPWPELGTVAGGRNVHYVSLSVVLRLMLIRRRFILTEIAMVTLLNTCFYRHLYLRRFWPSYHQAVALSISRFEGSFEQEGLQMVRRNRQRCIWTIQRWKETMGYELRLNIGSSISHSKLPVSPLDDITTKFPD